MNTGELEAKIRGIVTKTKDAGFVYALLLLYGVPKSAISETQKNPHELSKDTTRIIFKRRLMLESCELGVDLAQRAQALLVDKKLIQHKPRFVITTDYESLYALDIQTKDHISCAYAELAPHSDFFLPWKGVEKHQVAEENPADVKAAVKMAKIYDIIVKDNPDFIKEHNHDLNIFLTRLLFCFFAEDTGIFGGKSLFTAAVADHSEESGADLRELLKLIFASLDEIDKKDYPGFIQKFPYVNGSLFSDVLEVPAFSKKSRQLILECGEMDWCLINPDIFGSMFQAVKTEEARGNLGQHYTSVPNIMKVIDPLFLDELKECFKSAYDDAEALEVLNVRLSKIRIFDPACGSGNFLIIAFKQLRYLEMDIIKRANELNVQKSLRMNLSRIELSQFYGIEIDDFACEVAKLSLWLAEHQMNSIFRDQIGDPRPTLPLRESGHITCANSLRIDWSKVCPPIKRSVHGEAVYILGNPPYLGYSVQDKSQKEEIAHIFREYKVCKNLDYISCWFYLGKKYLEISVSARCAFVSTNSISQGEHVSALWPKILDSQAEIFFAYTSFKWTNNAKDAAGVTCCIIALKNKKYASDKFIYNMNSRYKVEHINAYLQGNDDVYIERASKPMSALPIMIRGSLPADGGNLIMSNADASALIAANPHIKHIIKRYIGADEYINSYSRSCLWLNEDNLDFAMQIPEIRSRIDAVRDFRLKSTKKATQQMAVTPWLFAERRYNQSSSIIVPAISSERRDYIPIGFLGDSVVINNKAYVVYDAEPWMFSVLTSCMHMTWVRAVAGRLETRLSYINTICYNAFPFPKITNEQKNELKKHAEFVLDLREKYPSKTLADLYDPDKMPVDLLAAHQSLDLAVDACYREEAFSDDEERLTQLFALYKKMTAAAKAKAKRQADKKAKPKKSPQGKTPPLNPYIL